MDNIRDFGAAEEVTKQDADALAKKTGEPTPDMRWVEGWRGDEVRARLVVRQFNESKRHDLFSGTPDARFMRSQKNRCRKSDWGNPCPRAICVNDISVAFMHADAEEEIIVKVPPGVKSGPRNTGYWRLLKALSGTRKASQ